MTFIHSIKFRFTLWYLVVLAALLLLLSAGVYSNLSRSLNTDLDNTLKARAEQLISLRDIAGSIDRGRFEASVGELVSIYFYQEERMVQVSDRSGDVPADAALIARIIGGETSFMTVETEGGRRLRVFAAPYMRRTVQPRRERPPAGSDRRPPPGPDDPRRGPGRFDERILALPAEHPAALFIGRDMEYIDEAMAALLRTLLFAVPLTLLIAGGGGVFLAGRVLKPVDRIASVAREIQESDLSRRIDVSTRDELGRLAVTINRMIERLEKAFRRQKQFTGDASHELRTPLAVIEAESTLALQRERDGEEYRRSLRTIADEAKHMATIIDQLLNLARIDAGGERFSFEDVRLGDLLQSLCALRERQCREKGIALQLHVVNEAVVKGNHAMLRLLFSNLVENATKYTQSGGTITVSLRGEGKSAVVSIADTGMGIPAQDLPHIFDRFYRVDKAHSRAKGGSGLGLSICKQIVEVHGGSIGVASEVGRGSTFTVRFC